MLDLVLLIRLRLHPPIQDNTVSGCYSDFSPPQLSLGPGNTLLYLILLTPLSCRIDRDADDISSDEDSEKLGSGASTIPEYWLQVAYEPAAGAERVVALSTDCRRCIKGEVSWSDVVSTQWQIVEGKSTQILKRIPWSDRF